MAQIGNTEVKRAIISVFDKQGIVPLAEKLSSHGIEIYSTGGTYKKLEEAGIKVLKISELTNFPEIMNGRVKTLHPKVFAGLLADSSNPAHMEDLNNVGVEPFQLVVVNLYPFSETYRSGEKQEDEIIEMIDIGGPSMLRASAKNFKSVAVLSDPDQYTEFIERLENNNIDIYYKKKLAASVFLKTALYDAEIIDFFGKTSGETFPEILFQAHKKNSSLRYGENPDQKAAIYSPANQVDWQAFEQLHGKEISYNNYIDCIAAYKIVAEMKSETPVCANIKHTNPCGVGLGNSGVEAYKRAVKADSVSYFGGIVSTNVEIDRKFALELKKSFLECIIAPAYTDEALTILTKKKNLRLLIPNVQGLLSEKCIRDYGKGILLQETQDPEDDENSWQIVTERKPAEKDLVALKLGWKIVKQVKSNAIVIANDSGSVGIGAGQMSRVDSMKVAVRKSREAGISLKNTIIASDAFFPFRDSIDVAAEAGIIGVIQPGGSIRDEEVIKACNEKNMYMIFTGKRVFKH